MNTGLFLSAAAMAVLLSACGGDEDVAMPADDANLARAPGHLLLDAGLWRDWMTSAGPLQLSLAVDNLADRRHVASVVVNDGNGRYYEPGAGRSWRLGLRWRWGGKRPG